MNDKEIKTRKRKLDASGPEPLARDKFLFLLKAGHSVRSACGLAGVSMSTYFRYRSADNEFALAADYAKNAALGRVEAKLLEAMEAGNITAIIFYLKTRGGESWGAHALVSEEPELVPPAEDPEIAAGLLG